MKIIYQQNIFISLYLLYSSQSDSKYSVYLILGQGWYARASRFTFNTRMGSKDLGKRVGIDFYLTFC